MRSSVRARSARWRRALVPQPQPTDASPAACLGTRFASQGTRSRNPPASQPSTRCGRGERDCARTTTASLARRRHRKLALLAEGRDIGSVGSLEGLVLRHGVSSGERGERRGARREPCRYDDARARRTKTVMTGHNAQRVLSSGLSRLHRRRRRRPSCSARAAWRSRGARGPLCSRCHPRRPSRQRGTP